MVLMRALFVLVLCVGLASCLTCYQCHAHIPGNCRQQLCTAGQACIIHHSNGNHGRRSHITLPQGCVNGSECNGFNCCHDDECIRKVMAAAHAPLVTINVPSTTPSPFICQDEVFSLMTNCQELASSGACGEHLGVHVCQQTCGFCDYVTSTFGDRGYCSDNLMNNQCSSQNMCADTFAIQLCPRTCGLCATKLQSVIIDFLKRTTTTATTFTTTTSTTTTTTTTPTPCVDTVANNGCASLPNVCQDSIARSVCPRFCNLCDTAVFQDILNVTNKGKPASTSGSMTTLASTTHAVTTLTASLSTFTNITTSKPLCIDQLGNNGCGLLPAGVCKESVAPMMCPKFCNLCG